MQEEYPLRKPYATRVRTLITCLTCSNELYLIHAPYHPFKHWCLRCDKPTAYERRKAAPPKQQVTDPSPPESSCGPTGESTTNKGEPSVPYKIAITGHFRTGKDTFADMLAEAADPPTVKLHFADALKYEVAKMVGAFIGQWGRTDDFFMDMAEDRQLNGIAWQWWGEWRRRKTEEGYWIRHPQFQNKYRAAVAANSNIIISDMRHVNEAEWCRKEGFYLVRIVGPCRAEGERRDPNHASEVYVDELKVDSILDNFGNLDTLKSLASALLYHIERRPHVPFLGS